MNLLTIESWTVSSFRKPSKTLLLLFLVMSLSACNSTYEKIEKQITNTINSTINKSKTADNGIDIEDENCLSIKYDRRSVCRMQVHLNSLGYPVGKPDGIAGKNTYGQIKRFQTDKNMTPVDGAPSVDLLAQLRLDNSGKVSPLKTGAVAGGACALLAAAFDKNALVAATVCGLGGAVFQNMSNESKEKYALTYYEIKDDNERNENEIAELTKRVKDNDSLVASYKTRIENLIVSEKDDKAFIAKAAKMQIEIEAQSKANRIAKSEAEIKVAILEDQINDMDEMLKAKPGEEEFTMTLASLKEKKSGLVDTIQQSSQIEREILAQTQMLNKATVKRS